MIANQNVSSAIVSDNIQSRQGAESQMIPSAAEVLSWKGKARAQEGKAGLVYNNLKIGQFHE